MGKGSAKGKSKPAGAPSGPDNGPAEVDLSVETAPRTYVYMGKVPADSSASAKGLKGKKGSPAATGKGGGMKGPKGKGVAKGKDGHDPAKGGAATKGNDPKGGKAKGKSKGGKPSGEPSECHTPTPKQLDPDGLNTGTPPTKPPTNLPTSDTKLKGEAKGTGASQTGKGAVDQSGKGKGWNGCKGKTGAHDQAMCEKDAVAQTGKDSQGGKGKANASADMGKSPAISPAPSTSSAKGSKGKKGSPAGATGKGGGMKGPTGKGVAKGKDGQDPAKGGAATKGNDPKGGKAKGKSKGGKPSGEPSECHTPTPKQLDPDGLNTGTPPPTPPTNLPTIDTKLKGEAKGTGARQTGKGAVDQSGKGKGGNGGKGKTGNAAGQTKGTQGGKGKKGVAGKGGVDGNVIDHTGQKRPLEAEPIDRGVSILRLDTNISELSDGTGPVDMEPLSKPTEPQHARPLTESEKKQIEAYAKDLSPNGLPRLQDRRFEFLRAFLLDKDNLASIKVEPYYEEHLGFLMLSESKEKEKFIELPLCIIRQRYEGLPGGKEFVENLQKSQIGKKHPQSDLAEMRIYKLFESVESSSASINRCGNRTSAAMTPSSNRAERKAIAEALEGKVAGMNKIATTQAPKGSGKGKGKKKTKDRFFGTALLWPDAR
ncbi:NaCP60E [Symbiodinium sp. CCMP2592]|nr:NaCP60E [Symbiodinium sp. CCMP2592]